MPPGANPLPLLQRGSKGPSMLQSCGTSTARQLESSKLASIAVGGSPMRKRQPRSRETYSLPELGSAGRGARIGSAAAQNGENRASWMRLERMALIMVIGRHSGDGQEAFAEGSGNRHGVPSLRQSPGDGVDAEDDGVTAVLIGKQEPLGGGVEGEIARGLPSARVLLHGLEPAVCLVDREDGHAVVAPVGAVEKPAIGMNLQLGACVCALEIGGQRGNRLDRGEGPGPGVPVEGLDRAGNLVDQVDPAPAGVEADV